MAARSGFRAWQHHMLRSDDDAHMMLQESGLREPYSDPALVRSPAVLGDFCQRLHQCGMLRWHLDHESKFRLGVFFIAKKSGQVRNVFDTRMVNCRFSSPPSTKFTFSCGLQFNVPGP